MPRLSPDDPRLAAPDFPHGTPSGYTYGCPCENCCAAHTASMRSYRRRNPDIQECPRVPTGPSVRHVQTLLAYTAGSLAPLARASGISRRTLMELAGSPSRPIRKYMRRQTEEAILAVTAEQVAAALRPREPSTNRVTRARRNVHTLINSCDCSPAMIAAASRVPEQAVLDVLAERRILQKHVQALVKVTADDCYSAVGMTSARAAVTRLRALQANWWPARELSDLLGHDFTAIVGGSALIDRLVDEDVATLYERLADQIGPDADAAADAIGLGYYPPTHYDRNMDLIPETVHGYGETAADAERNDRARLWFRIIGYTLRDYPEIDLVERLETSSGVIQATRRKVGLRFTKSRGFLDPLIVPGQEEEVALIEAYLRPIAIFERTDVIDEAVDYAEHWQAMMHDLTAVRAGKSPDLTRAA